jgi:hypothetical protein
VGHKEVPVTLLRKRVLEELERRNYSQANRVDRQARALPTRHFQRQRISREASGHTERTHGIDKWTNDFNEFPTKTTST